MTQLLTEREALTDLINELSVVDLGLFSKAAHALQRARVALSSAQQEAPAPEPVAWLYELTEPGRVMRYASVSDSERRDDITDAMWLSRKMIPLSPPAPEVRAGVPEGWRLVPLEPTEAMLAAVRQRKHPTRPDGWDGRHAVLYRAMLAATPQAEPVPERATKHDRVLALAGPMAEKFEAHFGQSWIDPDWRAEASTWAAAWKAATLHAAQAEPAPAQAAASPAPDRHEATEAMQPKPHNGEPGEFEPNHALKDGWTDWVTPVMRGYLMKCCDCGLVHEVEFDALRVTSRAGANFEGEVMPHADYRVSLRMRRGAEGSLVETLERICAEAYQVLGVLADEAGRFGDPAVTKALDNLSQQELVHDDVLPFPSAPQTADVRDAARYRWLRKQAWYESALCVVARPKDAVKLGHDCPSLVRLDEAIDAALSQQKDQP